MTTLDNDFAIEMEQKCWETNLVNSLKFRQRFQQIL